MEVDNRLPSQHRAEALNRLGSEPSGNNTNVVAADILENAGGPTNETFLFGEIAGQTLGGHDLLGRVYPYKEGYLNLVVNYL